MPHRQKLYNKRVRFFFPLFIAAALVTVMRAMPNAAQLRLSSSQTGRVIRVFDGDTLLVKIAGRREKVRLTGIDTPEKDGPYTKAEPFGAEATDRTYQLAFGKTVTLVFGSKTLRDKYGRLLAFVILPDRRVLNEILLEEGLAEVYRKFRYPNKKKYFRIEGKARKSCLGLWNLRGKCAGK